MITPGRRGGPLLVGLTVGAVLVGVVSVARPGGGPVAAELSAAVLPVTTTAAPPTTAAPTTAAPTTAASTPTPLTSAPVPTPAPTTTRSPTPTTTAAPTTRPAPRPAPTTRPAAPPPVTGSPAAQVVTLTNAARADAGCAALTTDARLTRAAQKHSDDMSANDYFAHDSQDGRSFSDRETAEGYPSPGGENIAKGQQSAQEVVTAWMNSPGHRRNIEDCSFTTIGVGLATDGMYWTQNFGR